jgi:hypothetical protein
MRAGYSPLGRGERGMRKQRQERVADLAARRYRVAGPRWTRKRSLRPATRGATAQGSEVLRYQYLKPDVERRLRELTDGRLELGRLVSAIRDLGPAHS